MRPGPRLVAAASSLVARARVTRRSDALASLSGPSSAPRRRRSFGTSTRAPPRATSLSDRRSPVSSSALRCGLVAWDGTQRRWSGGGVVRGDDAESAERRKSDHEHCVEMVRARDMEGYLCGLLMPPATRESYFALRAFNVEIGGVKDASRLVAGRSRSAEGVEGGEDASMASRLRMRWWRDAVAQIYDDDDDAGGYRGGGAGGDELLRSLSGSPDRNPTLRSLRRAVEAHGLTHRFLRKMMEAREEDLGVTQYGRLRDVAQYGEDTVSSLLYLNLECVGVRDEAADVVASDVGVGLGILTSLRSTGFRASQGECSVPSDLAAKHSVSMDTLYQALGSSMGDGDAAEVEEARSSREALRGAAREMADAAAFHLHRARDKQSAVPKEGRACLLPAVCGLQYLDSLREAGYDVLHPTLVGGGENAAGAERRRRLSLMFLLGRTWLTGTF